MKCLLRVWFLNNLRFLLRLRFRHGSLRMMKRGDEKQRKLEKDDESRIGGEEIVESKSGRASRFSCSPKIDEEDMEAFPRLGLRNRGVHEKGKVDLILASGRENIGRLRNSKIDL